MKKVNSLTKKVIFLLVGFTLTILSSCQKELESPSNLVSPTEVDQFIAVNNLEDFTQFTDGEKTYDLDYSLTQEEFNYIQETFSSEDTKYYLSLSKSLFISPNSLTADEAMDLDEQLAERNPSSTRGSAGTIGYAISNFNSSGRRVWTRTGSGNVTIGNVTLFRSTSLQLNAALSVNVRNNTSGRSSTRIRNVRLTLTEGVGTSPRTSNNTVSSSLAAGRNRFRRFSLNSVFRNTLFSPTIRLSYER